MDVPVKETIILEQCNLDTRPTPLLCSYCSMPIGDYSFQLFGNNVKHFPEVCADLLKRALTTAQVDLAAANERAEEEKAIVNRIWSMFGNPSYKELNWRSIYDLIEAEHAKFAFLKELVYNIRDNKIMDQDIRRYLREKLIQFEGDFY